MKYKRLTTKKIDLDKLSDKAKSKISETYLDYAKVNNALYELENKIEKGTLIDIKTISGLLNEWFECPCNFTLNEEDVALYMFEKYGDWCDKNCDKMLEDYSPCWEMYLKAKLKELQE